MRLQRHKLGVEDFELLTMIGKGAFGEVNAAHLIDNCSCFGSSFASIITYHNDVLKIICFRAG